MSSPLYGQLIQFDSQSLLNDQILHGRKIDITRLFEFETPIKKLDKFSERKKKEKRTKRSI